MTEHSILIVDDEPNVLKSLKRLLMETEYNIITAQSGEEGLEKLESNKIDVVVSDYRMPGMNGVEFLSKVKERSPDTIRLILSGYADAVAIVEAINEGQIYRFITKPWNDQELLTTISSSIEQHNLQQEFELLYLELQRKNRALEDLTKTLEAKVRQRTYDLQVKNRALALAQNILNYLPVGVIGVDPSGTIVYMNGAIADYLPIGSIGLSMSIEETLSDFECEQFRKCLLENQTFSHVLEEYSDVAVIWIALPDSLGAIGLYYYTDYNKYQAEIGKSKKEIGAGNER